jgi:hypothetical protein
MSTSLFLSSLSSRFRTTRAGGPGGRARPSYCEVAGPDCEPLREPANRFRRFSNGSINFTAAAYGRGAGVGRARGVGVGLVPLGVAVGVAVGVPVAVAVGVAVGVAVAVAVAVGVGVGLACALQKISIEAVADVGA